VAALLGGVALLQTRASISHVLCHLLEERALSTSRSLADSLLRPLTTGDHFAVVQETSAIREWFPDIRYVIVRDRTGRTVASTFQKDVPSDLQNVFRQSDHRTGCFQVLGSREGRIFDVICPILKGNVGTLQLGVLDSMVTKELSSLTRSVLWSLVFCLALAAVLALALTHLLTRPINRLVQVANRIREGDFEARAEVRGPDEIGHLAAAFNQMAEGLQNYRREVQEKEKARLSLLDRIVQAQEEERKSIARELHDHLGQSLMAILLGIQSQCEKSATCTMPCRKTEQPIRQLIEEVQRMAWGMRPSILDDYGLDSALARHIEEVTTHSGFPIDYQYTCPSGLGRLPSRVEITLFRVAQEAITNILRHAQAGRASVVVLQQRNDVTLLVEDNGRGFDPTSAQKKGYACLGLTGMRERAALLGGTCAVESVPGKGTTIRVRIPLREEQTCPSES
jgi:signal transduction histidine kinase